MAQTPIPSNKFYVEFDGMTEKLIKSVTEVNFEAKTAGHEKAVASTKGGLNIRQTTSSGFDNNPNITIEVYVREGDMAFYNWMKNTLPGAEGGNNQWGSSRKNGSVVGYDSEEKEAMRWELTNAWIKSYELSEFSAESEDLAIETYEIVCEKIVRTK